MRRTLLVLVGLFAGALLSVASARAEPMPTRAGDAELAAAAWPTLTPDEQALVELLAKDSLKATRPAARWDALSLPAKAALRGEAMRRLGLTPRAAARAWI